MSEIRCNARRGALQSGLALMAAGLSAPARAQAFPSKPIRIVVGFPAGNTLDVMSRVIAEHLRVKLGQPVIVENKPGANGVLAATEVARSSADGYTLLATNSSGMTINPQIYKKLTYQLGDFAPVSMVISAPLILTINPNNERTTSVKTLADLVSLAKTRPGAVSYASGGPGNMTQLCFETLGNWAGFKATHVPYKGSGAAQAGLLGREVDMQLDTPLAIPLVRQGRLSALAVTSAKRWRDLPEVPSIAESGYPGFDVTFWLALMAPAATPPALIQALYDAIASIRDDANSMRMLSAHGGVDLTDPQTFGARIKSETAVWAEVIKRENIQLD